MQNKMSKTEPFVLVAYSFGSLVGVELTALLEKNGYNGKLILIDGSPKMIKQLLQQQLVTDSEAMFETTAMCAVMSLYMPWEDVVRHKVSYFLDWLCVSNQ